MPVVTASQPPRTVLERQQRRESSARTYARSLPIVPVRASGMTVTGADGTTYLDCLSGAGSLALGHNHPVVVEAIRKVLDDGAPLHILDLATPVKDAFVETLFDLLPGDLARRGRIHFCGPTGADAVEAALKLTQTATGRHGVLAFTGAYHGMTAGALAVTGNVAVRAPLAPTPATVTRLPYPYGYRCPFGLGGDTGAATSARFAASLVDDASGGVVPPAAMILEPVQGEGGVVPAPGSWLRAMRDLTAHRGIPLIVDEVQTGAGRTGAMWAVDHAGITPDVLVLSKAIGGGLPLAVIVYDESLDGWAAGAHTGTFRGNQLAMAAGTATLRHIAENTLPEHAETIGRRLLAELHRLAGDHGSIGEVRGRGLMLGIEVVEADAAPDDLGSLPPAPDLAARIRSECLRRGLIVELGGRDDTVLRLLPPLVVTAEQADSVVERLAAAWTAAERNPSAA
ncbi:diaminobutyrate--2-oxoglutarate transaminase family protein [Actinopolymorpha pittospori]|uniref:Diaminobutyrate--2-oxoglutarate transaminase n=1 Tax=Actinopolymorpha pittospori TaxID=648752 RepID=A0A927N5K5_9ACTN|nr:diaminobutyrate--2-oxoglutarate transaminase family protein [Actinopolymorpha pittospori]MBE1612519.1 diaminobutyrate-2-oxoglutarate transaminase [Actinopolymorpha pittospori]